jgi:integrase
VGSVRKSPRGKSWEARFRNKAGKQRTKRFPTKSEAEGFLRAIEADIDRGLVFDTALGKTRFKEFAHRWHSGISHVRPGTDVKIEAALRLHVLPRFGDLYISGIEPVDVREWIADMVGAQKSPGLIYIAYNVFSRVMRTAEIDGYIRRTPCIGIELPRQTNHQEMRFLSPEQIARLAEAIEPRYSALIYTAAYTGLRWGELAGLQIAKVNFLRGVIEVNQAMTEVRGYRRLGPTKTGKARSISLPRFLRDLLAQHLVEFPSHEFVFTATEGGALRRHFYRRNYKPAVKRAGLDPNLRFHDLRHTCAALLIAQGAHPKEIQERLGHSTIRLTFDRYGHLLPTLDDRLRDGLDELWEAANGS